MASDTAAAESTKAREKLIEEKVYLVEYVVGRVMASLPSHIERDDLVSAGILGLIHAVDRFDPEHGSRFETYAISCIRGAVLEHLRAQDWLPRSLRSKARQVIQAEAEVTARLGRPATGKEIALELGLALPAYDALLAELSRLTVVSIEELLFGDEHRTGRDWLADRATNQQPDDLAEHRDLADWLARALEELPERERLVISLYYHQGLTLREVGTVFDVSESRACQLHTQALLRLRRILNPEDRGA
jgi:RNA polymerase sigma factor for flagellar operon FliA